MAITTRDKQALDAIYEEHRDRFEGRKEDYFALLHLMQKFGITAEQAANHVAFGGHDFAIDAYYIDRESRNLYLYQFKWSEDHNLFKESLDRLSSAGMAAIFAATGPTAAQNDVIHRLQADLFEHRSLISRVFIQFVFKGDSEAVERSIGIQDRQEALESKRHIVERFFEGREVEFRVDFISDRPRPGLPPTKTEFAVHFEDAATRTAADGERTMHVGFVRLADLHAIHQMIGQRFLSRNIRAALRDDTPPNRKIREALSDIVIRKKALPDTFVFNHNGVTLAAESLRQSNGTTLLASPRVLNGAQTLRSFARFIEEGGESLSSPERQQLIKQIAVIARVVVDEPTSDFVTQVTICNNQQNPVEPWHLRANDRIQCDLQDFFRENVRIYYSRQERAFDNISWEELEEQEITATSDIQIKKLAQTFLAAQGEIDRMSRLREVFETQKWYDECFRLAYLQTDARRIILAYKIGLCLTSVMKRIMNHVAERYGDVVKKSRNLMWAMLIQAMLNDDRNLDDWLERFGNDLIKAVEFKDWLDDLGRRRVYPAISQLLRDDTSYSQRVAAEQYNFCRTKEYYKRCMDIAADRYGWAKQNL